jgi:hypothetical protein
MSYLFLGIIILSSNFGAYNFYGEVPENVPTFLIKIQREQSEFYGGIIIQNQWLNDASVPELKTKGRGSCRYTMGNTAIASSRSGTSA